MLTIITVNYNTTRFCIDLVNSIHACGYPAGFITQIFIVDNRSFQSQRMELERFTDPLVKKIFLDESTSFAAANNVALAQAQGGYVCLLNPDTLVPGDALKIMVDYLEAHPDVAAVGPKFWLDKEKTILAPPNELPTLLGVLRFALAHLRKGWLRAASLRRSRFALRYWQADAPLAIDMLSGACIVASRAVWRRFGGLDERFPLYYEDSDWSRRVRRAGGKLVYLPQAEIIHYYNQSAGQDYPAALHKNSRSKRAYFEKYYPLIGGRFIRLTNRLLRKFQRNMAFMPIENLGSQTVPFELDLPLPGKQAFVEVAGTPSFPLACALFYTGQTAVFSAQAWGARSEEQWFIRAVDISGHTVLKTWRLRLKPSPPNATGDSCATARAMNSASFDCLKPSLATNVAWQGGAGSTKSQATISRSLSPRTRVTKLLRTTRRFRSPATILIGAFCFCWLWTRWCGRTTAGGLAASC